jgi:group I intron endonuclease
MKYNVPSKSGHGIYAIRSTIDSRIYIGSTKGLYKRFCDHKSYLISGNHKNKYLQAFVGKHGIDSLVFELVEGCELDKLLEREQYYLDTLTPFPSTSKGFNLSPSAYGGFGSHTEESKKKMSLKRKGIKRGSYSEAHRKSLSDALKNSEANGKHLKEIWANSEKTYLFLSPSGKEFLIKNMKRFCEKNNLLDSKMVAVYKGRRVSHKGWRKVGGREAKKPSHYRTVYQFSLDGNLIRKFSSIKMALVSVKTTNATGMIDCANDKKYIFKGFIWSFNPFISEERLMALSVERIGFKIGDEVYVSGKGFCGIVSGFGKGRLISVEYDGITRRFSPKDLNKIKGRDNH